MPRYAMILAEMRLPELVLGCPTPERSFVLLEAGGMGHEAIVLAIAVADACGAFGSHRCPLYKAAKR